MSTTNHIIITKIQQNIEQQIAFVLEKKENRPKTLFVKFDIYTKSLREESYWDIKLDLQSGADGVVGGGLPAASRRR